MTRPNWKERGPQATEIQMHGLLFKLEHLDFSLETLKGEEPVPQVCVLSRGKSQGILPTDSHGPQTIDSTITQIELLERKESTQLRVETSGWAGRASASERRSGKSKNKNKTVHREVQNKKDEK